MALDKNTKIEQIMYTHCLNTYKNDFAHGFWTWAVSKGIANGQYDERYLAKVISKVQLGEADKDNVGRYLWEPYHDTNDTEKGTYSFRKLVEQSHDGDMTKYDGNRNKPEESPYRIEIRGCSGEPTLVTCHTNIGRCPDGRDGNVFIHSFVFPAGTMPDDVEKIIPSLQFIQKMPDTYFDDVNKIPPILTTLSVRELEQQKNATTPEPTPAPQKSQNASPWDKEEVEDYLTSSFGVSPPSVGLDEKPVVRPKPSVEKPAPAPMINEATQRQQYKEQISVEITHAKAYATMLRARKPAGQLTDEAKSGIKLYISRLNKLGQSLSEGLGLEQFAQFRNELNESMKLQEGFERLGRSYDEKYSEILNANFVKKNKTTGEWDKVDEFLTKLYRDGNIKNTSQAEIDAYYEDFMFGINVQTFEDKIRPEVHGYCNEERKVIVAEIETLPTPKTTSATVNNEPTIDFS